MMRVRITNGHRVLPQRIGCDNAMLKAVQYHQRGMLNVILEKKKKRNEKECSLKSHLIISL